MKKALITGGSGYFGEELVNTLLAAEYECYILDINKPSLNSDKVTFLNYDICDSINYKKYLKGIDVVFHNVAKVPLEKDDTEFKRVNYQGTKEILNSSIEMGVKNFIYTSTSAVFGIPKTNPVNESTPPSPVESYGYEKLQGEKLCLSRKDEINIKVIRPRTIVGPGRLGIFSILFKWMKEGKPIPVFDNGDNVYQFVHSFDLAKATVLAYEKGTYDTYNIGSEDYGTMRETLTEVIKKVNSQSKIISLNSKIIVFFMTIFSKIGISPLGTYHSKMYGKSLFFDVKRANQDLQWNSKYSSVETIYQAYKYYVNEMDNNSNDEQSHHQKSIKSFFMDIVGNGLSLLKKIKG